MLIIGHGESLVGKGLGKEIDTHEVVRLKRCQPLLENPTDYGTRTDYACATRKHINHMGDLKAKEYWIYPKSPADIGHLKTDLHHRIGFCCDRWNEVFRELVSPEFNKSPHFTTGFAAIVMCLEWYPQTIYLAGFDNLWEPHKAYKNVLKNWMGTTPHNMEAERQMLPMLEKEYSSKIIRL